MLPIHELKQNYGSELAAIILCCRVHLETTQLKELEIFIGENELNWDAFIYLAARHRIRPVIFRVIQEINIPADVKTSIRAILTEITMNSMKLAVETIRIIELLQENEVEVVPYKGTAFSSQFYGEAFLRESSDIDLIIKQEDLANTIPLLKQAGYLPEMEDIRQYLGTRFPLFFKDYNLNKFKNGQRQFHLELHWGIAESYTGINPAVNSILFEAGSAVRLSNSSVKALNPVNHFEAVLIHHAIKDTFRFMRNILDISQAMKHPELQDAGNELQNTFSKWKLKKAWNLSQILSERLLGVSIAQSNKLNLPGNLIKQFQDLLCRVNFPVIDARAFFMEGIQNISHLQDSLGRQVYFYRVCLTDRFRPGLMDFRTIQFPKPLFFLYYLMKPFRSILKPNNPEEIKQNLIPKDSE